jgi:iron complex outermembrane receptor protein
MHSRIAEYTDDVSGATFREVEPLLTPRVVSNQRVDVAATGSLSLALDGRYVGRSQLDNTGNTSLILPAVYTVDASLSWQVRRYAFVMRVNNLGDSKRFSSGYGSGGAPYYFVLPPRNVIATMKVGL